jgi:type I restriction enzyme S subunit
MEGIWPMVPLGEILSKSEEWTDIQPDRQYRQVTVRLWGGGVVLRNEVIGNEIAAKRRLVVRLNQFILSRIDARNGAFGLVPESLDGAVVSNDFPTFNINRERIIPRFLEWMSKTRDFVDLCRAASEGTTNRVRLKVDRFLVTQIPLPPLDEQRRIAARIEELAALIEEVQELQVKAREEAEAFASATLTVTFKKMIGEKGWEPRPLREAADIARGKFAHRPRNAPQFYGGNIPFIQIGDISSSNRHIRQYSQTLNQEGLSISRIFPKGTVVIAITGATIGATGILTFDSCFPDSIVGIVARLEIAIPEFIYWAVEYVKKEALRQATQTTQPNINLRILNQLKIPIPPLSEQRSFVDYLESLQAQVDELTATQDVTQVELDALLPSVLDQAFQGES